MQKNLLYNKICGFFLLLIIGSISAAARVPIKLCSPKHSSDYKRGFALYEQISVDLYIVNPDNSVALIDGVLAQYDPIFNNGVDAQDGLKFPNINESFAIARNGKLLTVERRQLIGVTDTLFFSLKNTVIRNYQFLFTPSGLAHPCLSAFLEDSYLLTSTPVDLNGTTAISFSVDATPASKATDRFRLVFKPGIVWTGTINSDWFTTGNWLGDVLPSVTCGNALIPNTINKPFIGSGVAYVNNLNIQAGAALTVDNAILRIGAGIINSGIFDVSGGTIEMRGTTAQTIAANTFQGNNIKNLIISNTSASGVTLGGKLDLYGALSFGSNNNQKLVSAGYLNLRSTIIGTGRVADLTNNGANTNNTISGDVVVERFYPGRRAWRLVTAPVSTTRTIYNEWQIGGVPATVAPGSGTYITSPTGGNGLDVSLHFSLKTFDEASGALVNVGNTKVPISNNARQFNVPDNIGYFLFVRGDRTPTLLNPYPITNYNITTLRDTGVLQTGKKTFGPIGAGKFMLIGNPYASPVDFGSLNRVNIPKKFWAWDPRLNSNLGAYAFVDGQTGPYIITPIADPIKGTTGQSQYIQSSQAIFVQASGNGGTVEFNENSKSLTDNNTVFRPLASTQANDTYESLRANLYLNDSDTAILADGVYEQFSNSFSGDIDSLDALKFINFLENLGIVRNGQTLTLERRPLVAVGDTIFFKLWKTTERNYQFRFSSSGLNHPGLEGYLEDSWLKSSTPVDLNGYTNIDFSVTAEAASKATDRFRIVFKEAVGGPLPVTFTSVNAYQQSSAINVEWKVENEINIRQYEVERSTDGVSFTGIATVAATGNNSGSIGYLLPDENVTSGVFYYRIRSVSNDGKVYYSNIVKVEISKAISSISIFPNPVTYGTINIHLVNQPAGSYMLRLMNKLGQVMIIKEVRHAGGTTTEKLQPGKTWAHGTYQLEVTTPEGNKTKIKLLK